MDGIARCAKALNARPSVRSHRRTRSEPTIPFGMLAKMPIHEQRRRMNKLARRMKVTAERHGRKVVLGGIGWIGWGKTPPIAKKGCTLLGMLEPLDGRWVPLLV